MLDVLKQQGPPRTAEPTETPSVAVASKSAAAVPAAGAEVVKAHEHSFTAQESQSPAADSATTGTSGTSSAAVARKAASPGAPRQQKESEPVLPESGAEKASGPQSGDGFPSLEQFLKQKEKAQGEQHSKARLEATLSPKLSAAPLPIAAPNAGKGATHETDSVPSADAAPVAAAEEGGDVQFTSFLEQVTRLAGATDSSAPSTMAHADEAAPLTQKLSSDLTSLMHLSRETGPISFLQVIGESTQEVSGVVAVRQASAAILAEAGRTAATSELAQRLSRMDASHGVVMLTELLRQLSEQQPSWDCAAGSTAESAVAALQLAEERTLLLLAERRTLEAMAAELRSLGNGAARLRAELVGYLEEGIPKIYEADGRELAGTALEPARTAAPSAMASLLDALRSDAAEARRTAVSLESTSSVGEAASGLVQVKEAKAAELELAHRALLAARKDASDALSAAIATPDCTKVAPTARLMSASLRALSILQG